MFVDMFDVAFIWFGYWEQKGLLETETAIVSASGVMSSGSSAQLTAEEVADVGQALSQVGNELG